MQKYRYPESQRMASSRKRRSLFAIEVFNRRIERLEKELSKMPENYTVGDYTSYRYKKNPKRFQQHTIDNYHEYNKHYQAQRRFIMNSIVLYKNILDNFELIKKEVRKMPKNLRVKAREEMEENILKNFNVQLEELYLTSGQN